MPAPEKNASDSLFRQFKLLSLLQTGRWTGTREIQEGLKLEGIEVSLRTIQRDLVQLSERFLIEKNGQIPQGWRWKKDADIQSFPQMNSLQAVSFVMVEEHLRHLLPGSLLTQLRPWFEQARQAINQRENTVKNWLDRVRIIPPTQPLIPPAINTEAQQAIYEALLLNRKITGLYTKRNAETSKTYHLNPLAIVQRGPVIYLVCTKVGQTDIRTFAMHRFNEAHCTDELAHRPPGFDLDQYLNSGALGFHLPDEAKNILGISDTDPVRKLVLECPRQVIFGLLETPLSKDQRIEQLSEDTFRLQASVPLTAQLIWWLRGFAGSIRVLAPQGLEEIVKNGKLI